MLDQVPGFSTPPPSDSMALVEHTGTELSDQVILDSPLRLGIVEHSVHKMTNGELIVSTLRPFQLTIGLFNTEEQPVHDHEPMTLEAECLFENGQPVPTLPGQPALSGEHAILTRGQAVFKIRLNVLSSQRDWKKFRVRIATADDPKSLCIISEPMRTLTKLYRNPGGMAAAHAAQQQAAQEAALAAQQAAVQSAQQEASPRERSDSIKRKSSGEPTTADEELQQLREVVQAHGETINALREEHTKMLGMLKVTLAECSGRMSNSSEASLSFRSEGDATGSFRSETD